MQRPHRFLSTTHRRRRIALWALTLLQWIVAVLFAGREIAPRHLVQRGPRMSLEGLTRLVVKLIVTRAFELARRRPQRLRFWRHGRALSRPHLLRSLLGSRLRRALKHKDLATRIARLMAALHQLDACAERLAQRFRRRLTRLWPITPAPAPPQPLRSTAFEPAAANTS